MLLKKVKLKKDDAELEVEGHHGDDSSERFVILSRFVAGDKTFKGRIKENVEFCDDDPISFVRHMEAFINSKVDEGFKVVHDENNAENMQKLGLYEGSDDSPPKVMKELAAFVAREVHKTLNAEGYDVGNYGLGTISFKAGDEKKMLFLQLRVDFIRKGGNKDE